MTAATLVRPERQATGHFEEWLREHAVPYEVIEAAASTPWNAEFEPALTKTITVVDDRANPHLVVLDAGMCLDLDAAARALNCRWLTMLAGADRPQRVMGRQLEPLAPVEDLCGFPVHADAGIASCLTLTLRAAKGRLVTFSRALWEREAGIQYLGFAVNCAEAAEPIEWY